MRLRLLLTPVCAVLLGSCAYQGTIVQKDAAPLPYTLSYGIDGSYAFLLRDSTGTVRRQVVTPDVYNQYAIGDYFNDLQPARASDGKSFADKNVMTAMMSKVTSPRRTAVATRKSSGKATLAKASKTKKTETKIAKQSRPAVKKQARAQVAAAPQIRRALPVERSSDPAPQILRHRPVWDSEIAYVSLPRCR